jgi:Sulfatase-modifying factor enzyme 1
MVALLAASGLVSACHSAHAEDTSASAAPAEKPPIPSARAPASAAPVASSASRDGGAPDAASAPGGPCPSEMTLVGKACVDRWEARLYEPAPDGGLTPHQANLRPEKGVGYVARSEPGVYPQAYINRIEASAACVAAGKRLCTLSEWYRACGGSKGTTFPYGATSSGTKCNTGKPHLLSKLFGRDPRRWQYAAHFNAPALDVEPGGLAKTGAYPECVADNGTLDMVGNLHEWVSDIVDDSLEKKIPLRDDIAEKIPINWGHGIFMGGFFSTTDELGPGCRYLTPGHEPAYHDYSTGFRCCRAEAAG